MTGLRGARGRPRLDRESAAHAPRLAVRLPDRLRRRLADRAAGEGVRLSDAVRTAVENWVGDLTPAERREVGRLVRLSDVERETIFLASNESVRQLLEAATS